MKKRNGFVSNSSSSSFVVLSKKKDTTIELKLTVNAADVTDYTITTKEELHEYLKDEYGWGDSKLEDYIENFGEEKYQKYLDKIKDGYIVMIGMASNKESHDPFAMAIYNGAIPEVEDGDFINEG